MKTHIIVAVDRNGVFAIDNKIPWKCPEDMAIFKELTTQLGRFDDLGGFDDSRPMNAVIMGRKTYESIDKCLPNRLNFVVSNSNGIPSLERALESAEQCGCPNAFVIGGYSLFYEAMHLADTLFMTLIHKSFFKKAAIHQIFPYMPEISDTCEIARLQAYHFESVSGFKFVHHQIDLHILRKHRRLSDYE